MARGSAVSRGRLCELHTHRFLCRQASLLRIRLGPGPGVAFCGAELCEPHAPSISPAGVRGLHRPDAASAGRSKRPRCHRAVSSEAFRSSDARPSEPLSGSELSSKDSSRNSVKNHSLTDSLNLSP